METPKAFMYRLIREGTDGIYIDYYHDYAEPGYSLDEGQLGIVAANWNSQKARQCKLCEVLSRDLPRDNPHNCPKGKIAIWEFACKVVGETEKELEWLLDREWFDYSLPDNRFIIVWGANQIARTLMGCNDTTSKRVIKDALRLVDKGYTPIRHHDFRYDGPEDMTMPRIAKIAEYAGYEIEWSDEWSSCNECNRAVRVSPDSYGWRRSYAIINDCEFLCADCIREDPTDYIQELLDSDDHALTFELDLSQHGFKKLKNEYENGFYPGQNDDPKKIAKKLRDNDIHGYLFEIDSVGQFDLYFSVWVEEADWEKASEVLK